jgi:hypothetical protein
VIITTADATPCVVEIVACGRRDTPHALVGPTARAAAGAAGQSTCTVSEPVPDPVPGAAAVPDADAVPDAADPDAVAVPDADADPAAGPAP